MESNKKSQLIVSSDANLIDKTVEKYFLFDDLILNRKLRKKICDNYQVLKTNFTLETYKKSFDYIEDLCDKIIIFLGGKMSDLFKIPFSFEQWKIYYDEWLSAFLHCAYYCYNKISLVDIDNTIMHGISANTVFSDYWESMTDFTYVSDYRALICNFLFERMGGIVYKHLGTIKTMSSYQSTRNPKYNNGLLMTGIEDKDFLVVQGRMNKEDEKQIEKNCEKVLFKEIEYFANRTTELIQNLKIDFDLRKKVINGFKTENRFESFIDELLQKFMPLSLFEGIPVIYSRAIYITKDWTFKKIYCSAVSFGELFYMCCAIEKKKGISLFNIQHALSYFRYSFFARREEKAFDKFIMWNDAFVDNSDKIEYVAGTRFNSSIDKSWSGGNKILWVSALPELYYRCGCSYERYFERRMKVIEALPQNSRERLSFRNRPMNEDNDLDFKEQCNVLYPEIVFEDYRKKTMIDSFSESEVVIIDYWSSTILEAIDFGVPFLIFDAVEFVSEKNKYDGLFDKLKAAGIYYDDIEEFLKSINSGLFEKNWTITKEQELLCKELKNAIAKNNVVEAWTKEFNYEKTIIA